ncbi:rho guanine nucleotide exchange factor 37 isoform X2 [Dendropsophus ebraccatus]|uniref:rho guanine nucleotide exchange factor 37 isoform X2 n=1 Tax=Dendropsophus ebraccatus TaxID=150705 RepID=UPI003831D6F2
MRAGSPSHIFRCEDRLSTSSNQSYGVVSKLNYRSRNSIISPGYSPSRNDSVTGNHACNNKVNLSNIGNHGNSKAFKNQLEGIFSSLSKSSNRSSVHSSSSQSSVQKSFDDSPSYIQTSPEHNSAYDEESVYEAYPFADEQFDDSVFVMDTDIPVGPSYPQTSFLEDMDNPNTQRDVNGSEDTHQIEEDRIYENIPHIEEPVYDEVEGFRRIVQPAVEELISTEVAYVKSLRLLIGTIQPKMEEIPDIDVKCLFSNLNEILLVHESFLNELKKTEHDHQNQLICIGSLFQEYSKDMENVYTVYCSAYTRTTSLLQHYQETHVGELIQYAMKYALSGSSSHYTDLSFYLIMPVQRITKYPLLLHNILSTDTQNKESWDALQRAQNTMEEVNANINENKRRKEVAGKYLRVEQRSLMEKMSTLSTHTLSKKSQRISLFLKQQTGMVLKREDKEFDSLADRFYRLVSLVSQMEENVVFYVKNVEEYFLIQPETYPFEYLQGSIHPLNGYTLELCNSIFPTFKRRLQIMVLQPLSNLSECLKGPNNLIRKRMDKLLDYENLEEKHSETGKMTWEEEDIQNNYKTIHSMLLSELPRCILLSYQLLHNIFLSFIAVQKDLAVQGCFAAEEHSSQMQCSTAPEPQFRKWVEDCIRLSILQLSEFRNKFDEQLPVPIPQEHIPVIERQAQQLLKQYGPQKVYQVMSAVKGTREMELTLKRGDVVAVIQFADTKGNKNRWLVDTGGLRGYVPCSKLQLYQATQSPTHLQSPTHTYSSPGTMKTLETRRHSSTTQACPYPTFLQPQDVSTAFQIVAGYSFTARSQYEVSIREGEPVIVLEPHDKNGSPLWSLVEVSGQRGYVPSSYLLKVPVQELSRRTSLGNYT